MMSSIDPMQMLTIIEEGASDQTSKLRQTCANLLQRNQFVDVTLSCIDGQLQAHRLVLASVSPYLQELFTTSPTPTPCTHPMIILRNSTVVDVESVLEFIYTGKTKVQRNKLGTLLNVTQELGCLYFGSLIEKVMRSPPSRTTTPKTSPELAQAQQFLSQINTAITIKEEPFTSSPSLKRQVNGHIPIPPPPKLLKMNQAHYHTEMSVVRNAVNWNSKSNQNQIENFVYTPENLGMLMYDDNDDNNEEDEDGLDEMSNNKISINKALTGNNFSGGFMTNASKKLENGMDATNTAPASCPWCMQAFSSLAMLQKHIKTHVGNGGAKPYVCQYCNHEFARSAHLKRHIRTHTGEKPYECPVCKRVFSRQDKMKAHVSRHLQNPNTEQLKPTNPNTPNNMSLTITSYPSTNQSGQLPIKVLIPTNQKQNGNVNSTPSPYQISSNSNSDTMSNNSPNTAANNKSPNSNSLMYSIKTGSAITINPVPPIVKQEVDQG